MSELVNNHTYQFVALSESSFFTSRSHARNRAMKAGCRLSDITSGSRLNSTHVETLALTTAKFLRGLPLFLIAFVDRSQVLETSSHAR